MAKASVYGAIADGSTNCARAINLCLQETGVVEFDEGTYVIGGIGISNPLDAAIYWGFPANYTRGIKLIGRQRQDDSKVCGLDRNSRRFALWFVDLSRQYLQLHRRRSVV